MICSDSGKIAIEYERRAGHDNNVIIYDIKSSIVSRIENIKDYGGLVYFVGDMLFYDRKSVNKKKECLLWISYS